MGFGGDSVLHDNFFGDMWSIKGSLLGALFEALVGWRRASTRF